MSYPNLNLVLVTALYRPKDGNSRETKKVLAKLVGCCGRLTEASTLR
jgi:hypothetical protein